MSAMADRIMKRVRGKGRGWVFTPRFFLDFGKRGAIDMALTRLVQAGAIRRIGWGLYDYPRLHPGIGTLSPDATRVADAIAGQTGDRLVPSAATGANRLGLSTQVPVRANYATDGRTRTKKAAGRTITLQHSRAPIVDHASDAANSVLQLLAQVGRKKVDDALIGQLATRIDTGDMKSLLQARPSMPGWMGDAILKIGTLQNG